MMAFAGTLAECIAHWAKTLPPSGSRSINDARAPLVEFVGVTTQTIQRWTHHGEEPLGLTALRAMFFFKTAGYKVSELVDLARMRPCGYMLAKLLAFGVVGLVYAADTLGVSRGSVCRIAFGSFGTKKKREESIVALYKRNTVALISAANILADKISRARGVAFDNKAADETESVASQQSALPAHPARKGTYADIKVAAAAHLIAVLLPLATHLASDEATAEQRKQLRARVPGNGVFKLSNALNQLCGERARTDIRAKEKP